MQREIEYFAELSCRLEPVRQHLLQLAEDINAVCNAVSLLQLEEWGNAVCNAKQPANSAAPQTACKGKLSTLQS